MEIAFAGMAQIPIRPEAGLTYARAIRNALRQCPNILMVGEIRDLEVANLCLQAALSGHLVLSTLHVDTPVGVARRLVDMGVEPYLVSSNLAGVITSRLVRRLCPDCRQPAKPVPHALPKAAREWVAAHPDSTFYDVQGCDKCGSLGSRGRTAIHEVLVMTDRLRQMVTDGADVAQLRAAAVEEGTKPMLIDGLEKAAAGVTTIQEVLAALPLGTDP